MARSLTKRYFRMVASDDCDALLADLPAGCDPRGFHINGDLLPLRCAMYGAVQCLIALAASRPELSEEILSMADGNGERCIDWAAGSANLGQAKALAALAPIAASSASAHSHWPLARALTHARWAEASHWLGLAPGSAKLAGYDGRTALHLCAEPHFDFLGGNDASEWRAPPAELARALIAGGASATARTGKHHSALARAANANNLALIGAILDAIAARGKDGIHEAMSRGSAGFNPGHEAAWGGHAGALRALAVGSLDLSEHTERGFGLFHLAIRQGHFDCAQALFEMGAPADPEGSSTSCAVSALSSSEPIRWLKFLSERGVDLDRRDDHGAHHAELAWEKLGFEEAKAHWEGLDSKPLRDAYSFFGPLERAARSDRDQSKKIEHLLSTGLRPARLALLGAQAGASVQAQVDQIRDQRLNSTSFGVYKQIALGPMWGTAAELDLHSAPRASGGAMDHDDDDDFSFQICSKPKVEKTISPDKFQKRPSLIAYCAVNNALQSISCLLSWDAKEKWFSDADYLCAWREALGADANLPILRLLRSKLAERSIEPWGAPELQACIARLGPAKRRELAAPIPSAGEAFGVHLKSSGVESAFLLNPAIFNVNRKAFSSPGEGSQGAEASLERPWRVAALSEHEGSMKALLPMQMPWPAISCLHAALSACACGKPSLALWIAKSLPERAKSADPQSPWGSKPERALALWDHQIRSELRLARESATEIKGSSRSKRPKADDADYLAEGSLASGLLSLMLHKEQEIEAAKLIKMGLPAPSNFTRLADAIAARADSATGMGSGNDALNKLRSFVEAICERPDYKSILNLTSGSSILARVPDPALFDSFLEAGADPGTGPDNAFVALARRHASRLSPAFSERLARESNALDSGASLAVAAALASMKPKKGAGLDFKLSSSASAKARVMRGAKASDELGWFSSFEQGLCPISKALGAGNVDMAFGLAKIAPEGYCERACPTWMGQWMSSRIPTLCEALMARDRTPEDQKAKEALESMRQEISELAGLGARFGRRPAIEAERAAAALENKRWKCAALLWLMQEGFEPTASVSAEKLGYSAARRLERLFIGAPKPKQIPLAAIALDEDSNSDTARALGALWASKPALAQSLGKASSGADLPFHALLSADVASLLEADFIQTSLGAQQAVAKKPPRL